LTWRILAGRGLHAWRIMTGRGLHAWSNAASGRTTNVGTRRLQRHHEATGGQGSLEGGAVGLDATALHQLDQLV
jgi:hypothetical protein